MTAYRASFGQFDEMVFGSGIVIRRIEQPGGGATYAQVITPSNEASIDIDAYMAELGEWYEVDDEESYRWLQAARGDIV